LDDFVIHAPSYLSFPLTIDRLFYCPDVLEELARQLLSPDLSMPPSFHFQFMVNAK